MNRQREQRCLWAWHLSALVYEWSYVQVAHQIDEDFLGYLGERVLGAVVADCGCGPGVVTEKLLQAGASRVVAIDANASMIERARARLAKGVATGQVLVCHASHEADTLAGVRQRALAGRGFDIVLFKRSLYMPRQRALLTLRQAAGGPVCQRHDRGGAPGTFALALCFCSAVWPHLLYTFTFSEPSHLACA